MTNRIGRYFARGNDCTANVDRAITDLLFCDSLTRIYGDEFSPQMDEVLSSIEVEATRVLHHYGIQPPDPLDGTRPAA